MSHPRLHNDIDCRRLEEAVADVLGGEASPELERALDRHLTACAACAGSHAGLASLLEAARSTPVPDPGESYWAGYLPELRRRLDATPGPVVPAGQLSLLAWLRPAFGATGLVLLALLATAPSPERLSRSSAGIPRSPEDLGPALVGARDLSAALDRLGDPWTQPLGDAIADLDTMPAAEPELSGDLFLFFAQASDLDAAETRAVLAALSRPENG